jgi:1-acyl-sn-glycerol-3-phosphate acyltransferase
MPDGPVIVVANHLSTLDTLLLGWALPRAGAFLAKAEIMGWPVIGAEAHRCGGFPAFRGRGDQTAYATALAVLDAGQPVVLHPEGSRSPNGLWGMQRLRAGAARFALARPVPILPVALFGTDGIMPKYRLWPGRGTAAAHIGEPIGPDTYLPPEHWPMDERIRAINGHIDRAIRLLLPVHLQSEAPTPGLEPSSAVTP